MTTTLNLIACSLAITSLAGCSSFFYAKAPTGKFSGKLYVEWIAPNQFIYRPDTDDPLVYSTSDGRTITPRLMYTDAGSIPRLFWSAPGFGPWDFAPGYIVHDWLFHQHHCRLEDWQAYDFQRSAELLAEAMKTQMEKAGSPEPAIVNAVYEAVRSPIAKRLWEFGECKPASPPIEPSALPGSTRVDPIRILTVNTR